MKRLLMLMLLLFSGGGWAACTVSTVNASFGSVTSFALSGTGEVETTGRLVVACDTVLNVLTNDSVTLSYTAASVSGNSRATMKRTDNAAITDVIPTRLCGLSACASSSEVQIVKRIPGAGIPCWGCWGQGSITFRSIFAPSLDKTSLPVPTRCS